MTKEAFIMWLHEAFSDYPQEEVEARIRFYLEIIEDRMEEGLSEEEAVASVGSLEEVIAQIREDMPLPTNNRSRRRLAGWEIALLILGFPLWLPLLIAAFSVVFSIYITVWSVILSLWSVLIAFIVCSFFGVLVGIGFLLFGKRLTGVALLGAGLLLTGLSIFWFWGCHTLSNILCQLTKKLLTLLKNAVFKKEGAK